MKILLIRFSSIGDIVLTTPLARALKQQKDARVHYVVKDAFVPVLEHNPHVDRIFSFKKSLDEVSRHLQAESYDFVADLHHNLRSLHLKTRLRGVPSRSLNKLNMEKWLLVNFKMKVLPPVHIVERYFDTLKPLGVHYDGRGLDYFISDDDRRYVQNLPDMPSQGYHVVVVGGAHQTKQPTTGQLVQIVNSSPSPVVLLGGKADEPKADAIAAQCSGAINWVGKLSLNCSAAVLERAEAVVSPDTGLMHIAAAMRRRIISLWGNTIPEFGMYPLLPQGFQHLSEIKEVQGLPCRPCSKIGYERCPKKHFKCMTSIDVSHLW